MGYQHLGGFPGEIGTPPQRLAHSRLVGIDDEDAHPQYEQRAKGVLGYAEVTADESTTGTLDLTGLSVTVDVDNNRRIRVSSFTRVAHTAANSRSAITINEGAAQLQSSLMSHPAGGNTGMQAHVATVILTPSPGQHTYFLRLHRLDSAGTANISAASTAPTFILVEDIGAA